MAVLSSSEKRKVSQQCDKKDGIRKDLNDKKYVNLMKYFTLQDIRTNLNNDKILFNCIHNALEEKSK